MAKLKNSFDKFKNNFNLKCFIFEALLVITIVALDLISKDYMFKYLADKPFNQADFIDGFMDYQMVKNFGASFGIFQGKTEMLLAFTIVSVILLCFIWIFMLRTSSPAIRISVIFIFAGGIGNIVDRCMLGYVRDFLHFTFFDFPTFNVADSFVTVGTFLLIIAVLVDFFKDLKKGKENE